MISGSATAQEIEGGCIDEKIAIIEGEIESLKQQYTDTMEEASDWEAGVKSNANKIKWLHDLSPEEFVKEGGAAKVQELVADAEKLDKLAKKAKRKAAKIKSQIQGLTFDLSKLEAAKKAVREIYEPIQKGFEKLKGWLTTCGLTGFYAGGQLASIAGDQKIVERLALGGDVTNSLTDSSSDLGGGVVVGYNFTPWNNRIIVGPFVSFDWLDQEINHEFAGGTFIGSTAHWIGTAGVKAGLAVAPGAFLYGLVGGSLLEEELNIDFGGPVTSRNETVSGVTVGAGGEWRPSGMQVLGHPVSVFAQYQHTWWEDVALNRPAASPFFNYDFEREDVSVRAGINIHLQRYRRSL
jgi:hypothetical protein